MSMRVYACAYVFLGRGLRAHACFMRMRACFVGQLPVRACACFIGQLPVRVRACFHIALALALRGLPRARASFGCVGV